MLLNGLDDAQQSDSALGLLAFSLETLAWVDSCSDPESATCPDGTYDPVQRHPEAGITRVLQPRDPR